MLDRDGAMAHCPRGNSVGLFPIKFPLRALLGCCQINPSLMRLCIKHKYSQTTGTKDAIITECAHAFKGKQIFLSIFLFNWGMSKMSQIQKEKHWVCLFAPKTEPHERTELAIPLIPLKRQRNTVLTETEHFFLLFLPSLLFLEKLSNTCMVLVERDAFPTQNSIQNWLTIDYLWISKCLMVWSERQVSLWWIIFKMTTHSLAVLK